MIRMPLEETRRRIGEALLVRCHWHPFTIGTVAKRSAEVKPVVRYLRFIHRTHERQVVLDYRWKMCSVRLGEQPGLL